MNVVQVVPRYPPRTGGVETHVREVSERLVERGYGVTALTADDGEDVRTSETRNGVEVIRHRGFAPSGAFHVAPGILRTLRRLDADVVHAHNYHSLPLLFAAIATSDARFVATPHYHGGSASSFRDRLLSLYRPAGAWALRQADAVVAVSDWERKQLQRDFGIGATVIPNGVDVERFRSAEPTQREQPYLLTVGRLEEYKGVQHVIRALPELPEYELVVAGTGPFREDLQRIATETGVRNRVTFLGYVADDELPELYAGAEAYVTMSSFEAYGMTVGEALAAGTPCVVREKRALEDWADRDGCTSTTNLAPSKISGRIEAAIISDEDTFTPPSWVNVVDKLESVYDA